MPTLSLRLDEQQLLELAAKARVHGCKRGYLFKADSSKLKRLSNRWCCVFSNTLFYFESESVPKPLGVVFLEGTSCRPVEQIGLPGREVEVRSNYHFALSLSIKVLSENQHCACVQKEPSVCILRCSRLNILADGMLSPNVSNSLCVGWGSLAASL